jgi:hypothetical protein
MLSPYRGETVVWHRGPSPCFELLHVAPYTSSHSSEELTPADLCGWMDIYQQESTTAAAIYSR